MAKWLNIPVVVEGAEKQEQVDFLRSIGCEFVQGYYFARSMSVPEYEALLDSSTGVVNEQAQPGKFDPNELWESNPQMEQLFNAAGAPVAIYEVENGNVELLRANDAFYTMFGYEDMVNSPKEIFRHVEEVDRALVLNAFENAIAEKATAGCTYARIMPDGGRGWVNISLKYVQEVGKKHILFGSFADATAQHKMDEELRRLRCATVPQGFGSNKILIVDDREMDRYILRSIFEDRYLVLEAANGQEAMEVLRANNYAVDVVLLDLIMPVMDGEAFLHKMQKTPQMQNLPVIIITANDSMEQQAAALSMGAEEYIVKPFVREVVERRVNNVLNSVRSRRMLLQEPAQTPEKSTVKA